MPRADESAEAPRAMIKRTVEISGGNNFLRVQHGQLVVERDKMEVGRLPLEDLGVLIVDTKAATYTHSVLVEAVRHNAVVVLCDGEHHPAGMLFPIAANTVQTERLRAQVEAKRPLGKQLWQQIVKKKVLGQSAQLPPDHAVRRKLVVLAQRVRSGDPENIEAQAARLYWPAMLGEAFRRIRDGPPPNDLLNYGYMGLRAAMARAVCAAGLHPSLGFHHRNRYNPFCLADDLMEPFRPLVDARVRAMWSDGIRSLDSEGKRRLLEALTDTVSVGGEKGPVMVAMHKTAASLSRCYEGLAHELALPEP